MTRYAAMFDRCRQAKEGAFGAFLMLGDPDLATSATLLDALVEGGADMVELGIPFSDPVADGPVIQAAYTEALAAGATVSGLLEFIAKQRKHRKVPFVLMCCYNLIHKAGIKSFAGRCRDAGIEVAGWWIPAAASPSGAPAPTVIVVHGFTACRHDHAVLLPAGMLYMHGFSVLLVDLRDHGDSTREDGRFAGGDPARGPFMEPADIGGAVIYTLSQPRRMRTELWTMWSLTENH